MCEQVPAEERTRTGIEKLARMLWDAQEGMGMTWTGTTYHITGAAHERWMEMASGRLMRCVWLCAGSLLPVPTCPSGHAGGTRAVGPLGSGDLSRLVAKKKK